MEQKIEHVVLRAENYEKLMEFLTSLPYKTSAQIISDIVNEVNANLKTLNVVDKVIEAKPEAPKPDLTIVEADSE